MHLKQQVIKVFVDDVEKGVIKPPYTIGEWDTTPGIELDLSGGEILKFSRDRPAFGLALRKLIFS